MELLFTINCETCAARLKVSHPSAIDQVLACPKCGNMVRVQPPDGWKMPADIQKQLDAQRAKATSSSGVSTGEFDEVDNLLTSPTNAKPATQPPRTRQNRQAAVGETNAQRETQKSVQSKSAAGQKVARENVVLPNEQWTATSTKNRRKALIIVASIIGLLLVASAITAAVVANWPSDVVASSDPDGPDEPDANVSTDATTVSTDRPAARGAETIPERKPNELETTNTPLDEVVSDATNSETTTDENPLSPENVTEPDAPTDTASATDDPRVADGGAPNLPDLTDKPKADRTGLDDILNPTAADPVEKSDFGTISDLLEESGTTMQEINDLAGAHREQQLIGQSKYFIVKPKPIEPNVFEGLKKPCLGIQYVDKPLLIVIHDISQITGVPISFDANSLRLLEIDVGKKISVKLTDTDFESVVNEIVAADDFRLVLEYDGSQAAMLVAPALRQPDIHNESFQVPFPNLDSEDAEALGEFVSLVQSIIAPDVWTRENNPGSINIAGDHLEISAPPMERPRVEAFVRKWNVGKATTKSVEDSTGELATLVSKAEPMMKSTFKVESKYPVPLETYLAKIHLQTGANIIVDWPSLLAEGWTPQTKLPANMDETTVAAFLKKICRALRLSYIVVDEKTVQITTFATVAKETDFEAYSCAKILAARLSQEQLVQILKRALGLELKTQPNLRVFMDAESQTLFVVAPQFIHRQIRAILDRLE